MSVNKAQPGQDVVSICVFCREDGTTLLSFHGEEDSARFPSLACIKSSWRLTVRKLINTVSGLSGREIAIMRVTKFWVPDSSNTFHILYKVKCPLSEKKQLKLQGGVEGLRWFSLDQVQQMSLTGQLCSPELMEYVAQTLQPRNFYPITADPEASKEGFDMLNEVLDKNIIVDVDTNFLTPQENLLKTAHFTNNEQKKIYKEFWTRTFPNLLMNKNQFDKFVAEIGWRKEDWPGLFTCTDVSSRHGLTFRDFILFLAATEPDTPHGTVTGEIRCQYIFRYFDKNKDNYLDQSELKNLILAISTVKGANIKPSDVDKIVETYLVELGLIPKRKISLNSFIKKVGELKLRGTSSIFRSSMSVLKYLSTSNPSEAVSTPTTSTPLVQNITKPISAFSKGFNWRGVSNFLQPTVTVDNVADIIKSAAKSNKVFEIATHAVKLNKDGLLEDVRPVDRVSRGKSMSLESSDHFFRLPSIEYYDEKTPANELLAILGYFTNEITPTSKSKNGFSKHSFNWGKYEMHKMIPLLITICDRCIKILEKEPRLLQITSPVYILGDLHGNYHDLMVYEQVLWSLGLGLSPCSLLFLGDYVDRGMYGVEIIAYLFAQKVKNPTKMFLIRGNHEIRIIQKNFTFYSECQRKFGEEQYYEVWNMINRVFDAMPLAAVVDNKIFCCHGGIPSPWLCTRIDQIDSIPSPLPVPEETSQLAWELMWNDPVKSELVTSALQHEMDANEGFAVNQSRKTGRVFSLDALDTFLKRNDLSHVIRAHEVKTAGFQIQQGGKLLTVFSSSGYCGGPNEAACIFVSQEKIRVLRINTN